MNAIQLLRSQLKSAHETMEATMADATDEVAHFTDIGKALPVGAAYAHAVLAEDMIVSGMLAHQEPLAKDTTEVGVSAMMPTMDKWAEHEQWTKTVKVDLPKFKTFAEKVYAASDEYLAGLSDGDLENEIDLTSMGMDKKTVEDIITNFLILHMANLAGEVSAAKGFQGQKGYPW